MHHTQQEETAGRDWTEGGDALIAQCCASCLKVWAFKRSFCPACGDQSPQALPSTGRGQVHAITRVERAPNDEFRALAPYVIVLVDLAEGFRLMGHGESSLAIGDAVQGDVRMIAGRKMPYFSKEARGED